MYIRKSPSWTILSTGAIVPAKKLTQRRPGWS